MSQVIAWRHRPDSNRGMRDLQSLALPTWLRCRGRSEYREGPAVVKAREAAIGEQRLHQLGRLAQDVAHVLASQVELQMTGVEPRDVEQIVHQLRGTLGRALHGLEIFPHLAGVELRPAAQGRNSQQDRAE